MRLRGPRFRVHPLAVTVAVLVLALVTIEAAVIGAQTRAFRSHLLNGAQHLRAAQTALGAVASSDQAFRVSSDDLDTADAELVQAEQQVNAAGADLRRLRVPLAVARRLPLIGPTASALPALVEFAGSAGVGGRELIGGLRPLARERDQPSAGLSAPARFSSALNEGAPSFEAAHRALAQAATARQAIDDRNVLPPLRGSLTPLATWDQEWPRADRALVLLIRLPTALQAVLGYDGQRSYAVLGENSAELRPTGGFLSSMGIMQVDGGILTQRGYRSIYTYDPDIRGTQGPLRPAPAPIVEHLGIAGWHIQDSNWSPDFPTSAAALRAFLKADTGTSVDGVIAFDSYAVQDLLRAVGPVEISVDGQPETFTAENWLPLTTQLIFLDPEHPDLTEGKGRILAPLLEAVIARVDGSSGDQLTRLVTGMRDALSGRHILFAFDDPVVQKLVYDYGADGSLRLKPGTTPLFPVEANLSYSKIGPFIRQSSAYELWFDEAGILQRARLTLNWQNTVSDAEINDPVNRITGDEWNAAEGRLVRSSGVYGFYERIFAPPDTVLLSTSGAQDAVAQSSEQGWSVFGTYVRVEPGQSRQLALELRLPNREARRGHFVLALPKQSGTEGRTVEVTVHTMGRTAPKSDPPLTRLGAQVYRYQGALDQDFLLDLDLAR